MPIRILALAPAECNPKGLPSIYNRFLLLKRLSLPLSGKRWWHFRILYGVNKISHQFHLGTMGPSYYGLYVSSYPGRVEVLDSGKRAVLYRAKIQPSKPELYILRPSAKMPCGEFVALATFRRFSSDVDIQICHGQHLKMRRKSLLASVHTFSVAGIGWGWRRDGLITSDLRLIQFENKRTIATFQKASSCSGKMLGIFAVFGTHQPPTIDAIIVTGLAKLGHQWVVQRMGRGT